MRPNPKKRKTLTSPLPLLPHKPIMRKAPPTNERVLATVGVVVAEERFSSSGDDGNKRLSMAETKPQLREQLVRAKEQLANEVAKGQASTRQQADLGLEVSSLKDQLQESRNHVRSMHQEKQRLEKQIHNILFL